MNPERHTTDDDRPATTDRRARAPRRGNRRKATVGLLAAFPLTGLLTGKTALLASTVLAAGLLVGMPITDRAQNLGQAPEVEEIESVPVSAVEPLDFDLDDETTEDVPLPDVNWPEVGDRVEVELERSWTDTGLDGVELRATGDAAEGTAETVTLEIADRPDGSDGRPPGLIFNVVPMAPAVDRDPEGDDGQETEPPEPDADDSEQETPEPEATEPAPEVSPSPEASPTPEPDSTVAPSRHGTVRHTEGDLVPAETGEFEIRIDYSSFAAAVGGDWASRLALYAIANCDEAESDDCSSEPVPLKSTNHTGDLQVTATIAVEDIIDEPGEEAAEDDEEGSFIAPTNLSTTAGGGMIALMAGPAGDGGDYSATSLALDSSWSAGGHTGDFTWSYPLTAPGGVNGPEPELAVGYSSGSVDGLTAATNAQPSWVGEGFGLDAGFIERSFRPCYEDRTSGHNIPSGYYGGDLCWHDDNASISFGGKSSPLVRVGSSNTWRMKYDDGTRIQRLTRSAGHGQHNGAHGGEYWVVTTPDGTKAYFGLHKRTASDATPTNSVSKVPVYGNHAGDPCRGSTFASSRCNQGWRWSVDYIVDPHGNSMTFFYDQETNRYGANQNSASVAYDRAPLLKRIEYGTRQGSDTTGNAPARVVFNTAERCIPTSTFDCAPAKLTAANANQWPDVPFDQICSSTSSCANRLGPTFFSRKRLTGVTTQVWNPSSSSYRAVDTWELKHSFPNSGDHNPRSLWLESIQHTGKDGTDVAMPAVRFRGVQMANRVDRIGDSMSAYYKRRVNNIITGTGASISVTYADQQCSPSNKPAANALDTNTLRCFPAFYQPSHADEPLLEFFHKYVVTRVVEIDGTAGRLSDDKVTSYEYEGGGAWRYDSSRISRDKHRTWNEWRGYGSVITRTGVASQGQTYERSHYLRGMHGNRTHAGGTRSVSVNVPSGSTITDHDHYGGFVARSETRLGDTGSTIALELTTPWRSSANASGGGNEARIVAPRSVESWDRTAAGAWRKARSTTTYNSYGLPTQVFDEGDLAVSGDERCTKTSYASNTSSWLIDYPSQIVMTAGNCSRSPAKAADVISAGRTFYDGGGLGAAATRGTITRVDTASGLSGSAIQYQTDAVATYDAYGRTLSVTDAEGTTASASFSPATGKPTSVTTTNGLGHQSVATLNLSRGVQLRSVGADGGVTDFEYDALGRLTSVWLPNRTKASGGLPTYKFGYTIDGTNPNVVKTERLRSATPGFVRYNASYEIFDGLLRERSTQTEAHNPSGGRLITDTIYDSRGFVFAERGPYYNASAPSGTLVNAAPSTIPHYVNFTYDRAGRVTKETLLSHAWIQWATSYDHAGDRVRVTPPDGETPTTTYTNVQGQTTELRQHHGSAPSGAFDATRYTYTPAGQLSTITNAGGSQWSYDYDIRGNRTGTDDPDAGSSSTVFDTLGRPVSSTDAEGRTLFTAYDGLGRKTELRDDDAAGDLRSSWTYDTLKPGLLTSSTRHTADGDYTNEITGYDHLGRPVASRFTVPVSVEGHHRSEGYTQNFAYNHAGDLSHHRLPTAAGMNTETLTYGYTSTGLLSTFGATGSSLISQTQYDAYGRMVQRNRGHVVGQPFAETRDYEVGTGRLTQQLVTVMGEANPVADHRFTYNDAGDITMARDLNAIGTMADTQCYEYDYLRRLTEAYSADSDDCSGAPSTSNLGSVDPYWHSFEYSKSGNRTQWTERFRSDGQIESRVHDYAYPGATEDRPHAVESVTTTGFEPRVESFEYDETGAMTGREATGSDAGGLELTWDAEGRVSSAVDPDSGEEAEFVYDADGNRILKVDEAAGTTTLYVGAAEYVRDDDLGTITPVRHYSLEGEAIATRTVAEGLQHIVADAQGTGSVQLHLESSTFTKRRYAPFGVDRNPAGTPDWTGDRGFLNKTEDELLGTTHVGAREYDNRLGRFLSPDPIAAPGMPQQLNAYAYANNNPLAYSDPSGLFLQLAGVARLALSVASAVSSRDSFRYARPTQGGGGERSSSGGGFWNGVARFGAQTIAGSHVRTRNAGESFRNHAIQAVTGDQDVRFYISQQLTEAAIREGERIWDESLVPWVQNCSYGTRNAQCRLSTGIVALEVAAVAALFIPVARPAKPVVTTTRRLTAEVRDAVAHTAARNAPKPPSAAAGRLSMSRPATSSVSGVRLGQQLARESADSGFTPSGRLSSEAIAGSRQIIEGDRLGNTGLIRRLTSDGSSISDWGKYTTRTYQSSLGDFQVHFYMNRGAGVVDYGYDYKVIFNGVAR